GLPPAPHAAPAIPGATAAPGGRPRPAGTPGGPGRRPVRRPARDTGLTAPGAFVVSLGGTLLGGLADHLATDKLGAVFGTVFLATCVLVAVKTRIRDLAAAVIAPPLAFALTILLLSVVFPSDNGEGFLLRTVLDMFTALTFKAGLLWGGTALAAAIAFVRFRADREASRRRSPRDPREPRDPRAVRAPRDPRSPDGRDGRDARDPRGNRTPRSPRREDQ
ncbi:DUF6542 domain-containing protein, partial [Yinghuangia soli]